MEEHGAERTVGEGPVAAPEPDAREETATAGDRLVGIVESVLFAAGEPITLARLADVVPGPSRAELRAALAVLAERADGEGRGVRLVEAAGGYQLRTAPEHGAWVRRLFQQKPWRLTRATLETLAIIAYKQPITRAEIEAIRGVDVDGVLASLLARKLVKIIGRKEVIGRPLLYGTTRQFLEVFGLKDLNGLPALTEVAPGTLEGVGAGAAGIADEAGGGDESAADGGGDPPAEDPGGSGRLLAQSGGAPDLPGTRQPERPDGHGARDPGEGD
jgi:segregation and condensation protein B